MDNTLQLEFGTLTESDITAGFDCGISSLNDYLTSFALLNQSRHLSVTTLGYIRQSDLKEIIGYYTLCPAQIDVNELPKKVGRSLPKYPVPALRLCRLAVNKNYQNMKCGRELLVHALNKTLHLSVEVGGYCVLVDAINDQAKSFYEHFGFVPLQNHSRFLFMPIKAIKSMASTL